jgi:phytoene desaturase
MANKTAIIGAGVGGLATAARLASRGYEVEVFEKLNECGGRAHIIEDSGFKFDTGPSFVLMPDFFAEVFKYCHTDIRQHLELKTLDIHYKIFYPDGDVLTIHHDIESNKSEMEKIEIGSSKKYLDFLKETENIYNAVKPLLYKCFTPIDMINPAYWGLAGKLKIFDTYWGLAKKYFKSDKLCYAFTFEAMFIGVSPFSTPAFYSIITYADHVQKISHPMGGMYTIPKSLEKISLKSGAKIFYNNEIKNITKVKDGIVVNNKKGEEIYDNVVINADWAYSQTDILNRKLSSIKSSCSTLLIYLGLKKKIKHLDHHNLFLSKDLINNLEQIFTTKVIPEDPSFYIHVPTVTDPGLAPQDKEILYILIPVPNLQGFKGDMKEHEDELRSFVFEKINRICGIKLEELIEVEHRFYPQDFIDRYNIKYGATFGLAHTLFQSAFFRPSNKDPKIKGLYYVGASTQPGGGLPPVIASSRIVADLITGRS